jgi:hypothetical protein
MFNCSAMIADLAPGMTDPAFTVDFLQGNQVGLGLRDDVTDALQVGFPVGASATVDIVTQYPQSVFRVCLRHGSPA